MKYYSESDLNSILDARDRRLIQMKFAPINVRRCRDCKYYIPELPTIDTDGDFGYCEYRTDFSDYTLNDGPVNWYFTDENSFCDENQIIEED